MLGRPPCILSGPAAGSSVRILSVSEPSEAPRANHAQAITWETHIMVKSKVANWNTSGNSCGKAIGMMSSMKFNNHIKCTADRINRRAAVSVASDPTS